MVLVPFFTKFNPFHSTYSLCPMPCAILAYQKKKESISLLVYALYSIPCSTSENKKQGKFTFFQGLTENLTSIYKAPILLFFLFFVCGCA